MSEGPPEELIRAARKGRLVVFVGVPLGPNQKLPPAFWLTTDRGHLPERGQVYTASDIEEGRLLEAPAGAAIEFGTVQTLGTPRRPTRCGAWMEQLLRRRKVLCVGAPLEGARFVVSGDQACAWLDALAGQAHGASPLPPPPLPAVSSRIGLAGMLLAAAVAAASWLLFYTGYGGAQNWRWLRLVPGGLVASAAAVATAPLLGRAFSGQEIPAAEYYTRSAAGWTRWPRAPAAAAALLLVALAPWGLARRYVPASFLVFYESAGVSTDGRSVGACKAEEPCTLVVPRASHLHFDGPDGSCVLELPDPAGLIFIDTQSEGCEAVPADPEAPNPRG